MNQYGDFGKETEELMTICERNDRIPPELFKEFGVKRGLRDVDGTGVLAGISNISRIDAFKTEDGKKVPCDGQLWYRGYNVIDLIHGLRETFWIRGSGIPALVWRTAGCCKIRGI